MLVVTFEGNIWAGQATGSKAGLSLDSGASPQQQEALQMIWGAEVPGKVAARAEALTGPMTPPGQRVQMLNAPGSEVGPGQVATWGKATTHKVEALGLKWEADGKSSKHIPFDWSGPQPS